MARYIKDIQTDADAQTIHAAASQYLVSEGYEYIEYDGENVFKKGNGVWSNPTFFKFSYYNNTVRMETWMKYAFFPGVYVGELGVTGFVGSAMKGPWKKRIANLENMLSNTAANTAYYPTASFQKAVNETQAFRDENRFDDTCVINETRTEPAAANTSFFCNRCGSQMPEGVVFCSVCGKKRSDTSVQNATPQSTHFYQQGEVQATGYIPNETPLPSAGRSVSRKEFINQYAQPSLKKNITSIAILCYVCAGLTFIVSCVFNPFGIIDALILAGLALGMHLAKSKVCAILILILSIIEVLLSLASGGFPFWWLIAGVSAVVTFSKIEKQYKNFIANSNRY